MRHKVMTIVAGIAATIVASPVASQQYQGTLGRSASANSPAAFPTRGRIVFKGTHHATVFTPQRRPPRRSSLLGMLGAGGTTREYEGALTMEAEIDGYALTIRISGTGGINAGTYSGLIKDGRCRVSGDKGAVFEGLCGPQGFSGETRPGPGETVSYKGSFQTTVVSVEDYDERDRRRAAADAAARRSMPAPQNARPAAATSAPARSLPSQPRPVRPAANPAAGKPFAPGEDAVTRAIASENARTASLRRPGGYMALTNQDGSVHPCLEKGGEQGRAAETETRNGYGDLLKTDSYSTGTSFRVHNRCSSSQVYGIAGQQFDVPAKSTITLFCSYSMGENGFGQIIPSGISSCSKNR